ncbi:hypothetical protein [Sphingobacterium paludis]|uniref:Lipoprotein n=1 Tax=Sphingobacterium paludis TaxID=1476465 RepID=A0A4R7D828_9SPHI|nr:hypothetical protein [Sphingobacterium paludis]TDS17393.1 hypothetical protein B0I21_101258 [Sphingobacterium paludis]
MIRNCNILLLIGLGCISCQSTKKNDRVGDTVAVAKAHRDAPAQAMANTSESLENIAAIQDAYVATVEKRASGQLDSTTFEYDCNGERNGRVTYFTENGQLVLVRHVYGEYSHHEYEEEYFVRNNQLFFGFEKATSWAFESGATEGATKDDIVESRMYYQEEKPFRCLQKTYVMRTKSPDNPVPAELPNKEVDCQPATSSLNSFRLLLKRRDNPTKGCLN